MHADIIVSIVLWNNLWVTCRGGSGGEWEKGWFGDRREELFPSLFLMITFQLEVACGREIAKENLGAKNLLALRALLINLCSFKIHFQLIQRFST